MPSGVVVRKKLVIVGDEMCGKTSLFTVFTTGQFPDQYVGSLFIDVGIPNQLQTQVPTGFENYVTDCMVDGENVQLALWDTASHKDYEQLRIMAYSGAHVVLVAFQIDSIYSLENAKDKWVNEVKHLCPGVPILLVGLKSDIRENRVEREGIRHHPLYTVTTKEGHTSAREIGGERYVECSALTGLGIDGVFEAATRAALITPDRIEKMSCCVVI